MDVTILIKTFLRPECLQNLLGSINKFYPNIPIVVVDDSNKEEKIRLEKKSNILYIYTPFDIGLSAGRNVGVQHIKTKYFILCEDDLEFTENTKLEHFLESIEQGFDIMSGVLFLNNEPTHYKGILEIENNTLFMLPENRGYINQIPVYDIVINFFIADTNKIKNHPWENRLKMGEHLPFFLKHKSKLTIGQDKRISANHKPIRNPTYHNFRIRAKDYLVKELKENYNIDKIVNKL